jgi:hypothetical protein
MAKIAQLNQEVMIKPDKFFTCSAKCDLFEFELKPLIVIYLTHLKRNTVIFPIYVVGINNFPMKQYASRFSIRFPGKRARFSIKLSKSIGSLLYKMHKTSWPGITYHLDITIFTRNCQFIIFRKPVPD